MVKSQLTSKATIKVSKTNGVGAFANDVIKKGEIVFIKGGYILNRDEMYSEKLGDHYWPLSDEYVLAPKKDSSLEEIEAIKLYINHSCEPNCGIRGEITGVALKDINIGEEITFDYAMLDNEEDESYNFQCTCGSPKCRHIITGTDWKSKKLQQEYGSNFALYLLQKMKKAYDED